MKEIENDRFAEERRLKILEQIACFGRVEVNDLSEKFGVSGATIRSDLRKLQRSGSLSRTHGGAILKTKTGYESKFHEREIVNQREKALIGEAALSLLEDGDHIVIDTGTTTIEFARRIGMRNDITVVTNDIEIAKALEEIESSNVILLGGPLRKGYHCTTCQQASISPSGLRVDKAFMAANSFSLENGASTPDIRQAETKKAMMAMAGKTILLCDSSKFNKVSFVQFASLSEIDCIVTDKIAESERRQIEKNGIDLILAKQASAD